MRSQIVRGATSFDAGPDTITKQLSWFAARLLFESVHSEEEAQDQIFEDRIILVRAGTEDEAVRKAAKFGREAREEFKNAYGKTVIWELQEILNVVELFDEAFEDDTEVYYSIISKEKAESIKSMFPARETNRR